VRHIAKQRGLRPNSFLKCFNSAIKDLVGPKFTMTFPSLRDMNLDIQRQSRHPPNPNITTTPRQRQ
jgi:hypothetical protein